MLAGCQQLIFPTSPRGPAGLPNKARLSNLGRGRDGILRSGCVFVFLCLLHVLILRWCWSSQVCWVTGATYSTDCQEEYLSRRLAALQYFESPQAYPVHPPTIAIATIHRTSSNTPPDGAFAFPESFQSPHFRDVTSPSPEKFSKPYSGNHQTHRTQNLCLPPLTYPPSGSTNPGYSAVDLSVTIIYWPADVAEKRPFPPCYRYRCF
ncbi:hypothetical protein CHARACLAT_001244 [Characodon lateralis]|uniref:Uncharacterized protein n=1 Tax=Characodon lateralis TaxID=208331 RepID=A0ABU7EZB5_9TELE|nr:hypothetical protein [Characodon lateralis]